MIWERKERSLKMNELKIFENEEFGQIRSIEIDGLPYFVGKDVAEILGYTNPQKAIRDHVDEEDKTLNESFTVNGTKGVLINESGLYSLILSSKLPTVKAFKRWVTSEVLPSIRKTGNYIQKAEPYNIKEIVKETICQIVPEIIRELEDKEERTKRVERKMKKLETATKKKIERLLYSERYSYYEISKLLKQEGIDTSTEAICFYAQNIGL